MYLTQERKLSETFSGRNVVLESYVVKTKRSELILSVAMDFGIQGVLRRCVTIPVVGRKLVDVAADIQRYQDVLLDIIDAMEESKRWFATASDEQHIRVLHASSPLLFNSLRGGKFLRLEIFGKGLNDLSFQFEYRQGGSAQCLLDRLEELTNWIRKHLKSIDALPLEGFAAELK